MKAAVFRGVQDIQVEDVEAPKAGAGDVIVAVTQCGICGSDLHTYLHGSFVEPGQVMGHEFVGEVVETGDAREGDRRGRPRDRLAARALQRVRPLRRGSLQPLRQGLDARDRLRQARRVRRAVRIPGAISGQNIFPLGDDVSDEAGATTEPLAVAVHAVKLAEPVAGATAVVLGPRHDRPAGGAGPAGVREPGG